jgi:hypothetical protein
MQNEDFIHVPRMLDIRISAPAGDVEADWDNEAVLLLNEEVEALEADALSVSEGKEDNERDAEAGPASIEEGQDEGGEQEANLSEKDGHDLKPEQQGPSARPPPGRRRCAAAQQPDLVAQSQDLP